MALRTYLIFFSALFLNSYVTAQEETTSVFYSNRGKDTKWFAYRNTNEALYKVICNEAFYLLDKRAGEIAKLESKEDWISYQQELRSKLYASLDKFEKTPLNAKVTGKIKKDTYTVEKILFESHPEFYVTGCLFIPRKRQKPAPCVIYCSGHTELGFRSDTYQTVILNLVDKGFVVFAFDPVGQGERLQYLDPETGKSKIGGSTKEHTYAGVQTLLTGTSLSDYFIWDGVRSVDYLLSRKEIDPDRIGITGRSGGGTQSAMIAAYDERIKAAAPECYITNFKRLLQSIGPQDAEQNPFNAVKLGFDHPDFLHLRAPKPSLIVTTTHDFFSQQGARETFVEARKSYAAFEAEENIQMVEDMGSHESTKGNRESVYAFFQKHLENPGDSTDLDVTCFKPEELWVTPTGQLQSSIQGKTTFDLNKLYFPESDKEVNSLEEKVAQLSGISFDRRMTAAVFTGKVDSENHDIEKYFIENDKNDYALPVLSVKNRNTRANKVLVWLSPEGKETILENEEIGTFLDEGYVVISADLPGIGELYDPDFSGDGFIKGVPFNYTFGAHLTGKTIPGIHAESIDLLVQFAKHHIGENFKIHALVESHLNSSFLHYITLKNSFERIVFINPIESGVSLINEEYYDPQAAYSIVPGSLPYYDLQDLQKRLPFYAYKNFKGYSEKGISQKQLKEILEIFKR